MLAGTIETVNAPVAARCISLGAGPALSAMWHHRTENPKSICNTKSMDVVKFHEPTIPADHYNAWHGCSSGLVWNRMRLGTLSQILHHLANVSGLFSFGYCIEES